MSPYVYDPVSGRYQFQDYTPATPPMAPPEASMPGMDQLGMQPPGMQPPAPGMEQATPAQRVPENEGLQNPATAPRAKFGQAHPRLMSFLQNLGPALAAINTNQQVTPYPQRGGIIGGLAGFGQGMSAGQQNIDQAQLGALMRKLRGGPAVKGGLQAIGQGRGVSTEQAQAIGLATGQQVETLPERGRRTGGDLTAAQEEESRFRQKGFKFSSKLAQRQFDFEREKFSEDTRRFDEELSVKTEQLGHSRQELAQRYGASYTTMVEGFPYTNRAVQLPLVERLVAAHLAGRPSDLTEAELAQLPAEGIDYVKMRGRLERNRTLQDLSVRAIEGVLISKYGASWTTTAPPEVRAAISFMSDPVKMGGIDEDFTLRDQYVEHVQNLQKAGVLPGEAAGTLLERVKNFVGGQVDKLRGSKPEVGILGPKAAPTGADELADLQARYAADPNSLSQAELDRLLQHIRGGGGNQ